LAIGKNFAQTMIAKPHPLLGVCLATPTSHVQMESAVIMASKFWVEAMVHGYHDSGICYR